HLHRPVMAVRHDEVLAARPIARRAEADGEHLVLGQRGRRGHCEALRSGIWMSSSSCALVSGAGMYLNVTASAMMSSRPEMRSGSTAALGRNSCSERRAVASEMFAHAA